ncbi:hypothetical protein ACFW4K_26755 [Nocardiopsis alba]|uniref:hypothetical protein n=1 Tax=Nocardiopsis alba TaxID=53437 RepID=UPI00366D0733
MSSPLTPEDVEHVKHIIRTTRTRAMLLKMPVVTPEGYVSVSTASDAAHAIAERLRENGYEVDLTAEEQKAPIAFSTAMGTVLVMGKHAEDSAAAPAKSRVLQSTGQTGGQASPSWGCGCLVAVVAAILLLPGIGSCSPSTSPSPPPSNPIPHPTYRESLCEGRDYLENDDCKIYGDE